MVFLETRTKDTKERIIEAAMTLLKEKGYRGASTKAIASVAGVNEITLFRHFGNKRNIFTAVMEKFSYLPSFEKMFKEDVMWDLQADLRMFALNYLDYFRNNGDIITIAYKELGMFPELDRQVALTPVKLTGLLVDYFETMKQKGRIRDCPSEAYAMMLVSMNFGFLYHRLVHGDISGVSEEDFIEDTIAIIADGLVP
ncbi:TetR/AcrR family transcriptional regulator [Paenibacillus dendritiformis]|uniref:TetR/AcrR family transcriptional regulator n=1 Tax=Paenibacillus dendritiformis TaxID=130049 RepID=UPI0030B8BF3F